MALTATQIVEGINAADFTEEEFTTAMAVSKLEATLSLKRAEIANLQDWLAIKNAEYAEKLDVMQQAEAAIVAAINELAPTE